MKTISKLSRKKMLQIEDAEYKNLPRIPSSKRIELAKKHHRNASAIKIILATQCQYQIQVNDTNYPDIAAINVECRKRCNELGISYSEFDPFTYKKVYIKPEGRTYNRASRITMLTYIYLGFWITDELKGVVEHITCAKIARGIKCSINSVRESLLWLENNGYIQTDNPFFRGYFNITIEGGSYTPQGLYADRKNGGMGILEITTDLFEILCSCKKADLRVLLKLLHATAKQSSTSIDIKEFTKELPEYIHTPFVKQMLSKLQSNNIIKSAYNNDDVVISLQNNYNSTDFSSYRIASVTNNVIEKLYNVAGLFGFDKSELCLNKTSESGPLYNRNLAYKAPGLSNKLLFIAKDISDIIAVASSYTEDTFNKAFQYYCDTLNIPTNIQIDSITPEKAFKLFTEQVIMRSNYNKSIIYTRAYFNKLCCLIDSGDINGTRLSFENFIALSDAA